MVQLANGKAEDEPPMHEEVREYLRKLLACGDFSTSDRNRRFLSYVVEETLAGRGSRIKAYTIAVAAFDRGEDFDPLTDPIVRIEASRLRRSLEPYYLTAGKADRIRIEIPKGSYIATFACADPEQAVESGCTPQAASDMPAELGLPCRKWSKDRVRIGPLSKGEFDAASETYAGADHRQAA
jgi:hypothetical protein